MNHFGHLGVQQVLATIIIVVDDVVIGAETGALEQDVQANLQTGMMKGISMAIRQTQVSN